MKIVVAICFLCFSLQVVGQKIHEIKTDILLPFFKGVHLSYEYIPNGKLGIEFEARYRWDIDGAYRIPPAIPGPESFGYFIEADQQVLTLTLAGKYYCLKGQNGRGLFAGLYLRNDILVTPEIDLHEVLTIPEYNYKQQGSRHLRNGLGILAGYKYVLKDHLLFEIGMGFDVNLDTMFDSENGEFDFAGIPTLKAGYRF